MCNFGQPAEVAEHCSLTCNSFDAQRLSLFPLYLDYSSYPLSTDILLLRNEHPTQKQKENKQQQKK